MTFDLLLVPTVTLVILSAVLVGRMVIAHRELMKEVRRLHQLIAKPSTATQDNPIVASPGQPSDFDSVLKEWLSDSKLQRALLENLLAGSQRRDRDQQTMSLENFDPKSRSNRPRGYLQLISNNG